MLCLSCLVDLLASKHVSFYTVAGGGRVNTELRLYLHDPFSCCNFCRQDVCVDSYLLVWLFMITALRIPCNDMLKISKNKMYVPQPEIDSMVLIDTRKFSTLVP